MSAAEWESLCDGCGKCCLHKLEDEDTMALYHTSVACRLLDTDTARCSDYANRSTRVPSCVVLDACSIGDGSVLPSSCAYRRLARGESLPVWHPLLSGDPDSARLAGHTVIGRVNSEEHIHPDDYIDHIIHWVNN